MDILRAQVEALRQTLKAIAEAGTDFPALYNTTVNDDIGWDQLIGDLEVLAGLSWFEEQAT